MAKILVIDDDQIIRDALKERLDLDNYETSIAKNAGEGLESFQKGHPDIVILDIKIPDMGGIEVLKTIKKESKETEVIMITGYGEIDTAVEAMREGAISFQRKPIDIDSLILSIEKAVDKLTTQRALLYKTRETELAWEFIAKISTKKEIEIDFRNISTQILFKEFFISFTNKLELCTCIFDLEMNVLLSNSHINKVMKWQVAATQRSCRSGEQAENSSLEEEFLQSNGIKEPPVKADENFFEKLEAIGVTGLSQAEFREITNEIIESGKGFTKTISTGKHSRVFFGRISLLTMEGKKTGILFMIRGERGKC